MPTNPYDLIISTIYIGGEDAVKYHEHNFDFIVNTSAAVTNPINTEYAFFPVNNSEKDVQKYFDLITSTKILETIRQKVLENKSVLVNCSQGMHRSCSMVACYLMKYENMNLENAMKFIKSKRRVAFNPVYKLRGVLELFAKANHVPISGPKPNPNPKPNKPQKQNLNKNPNENKNLKKQILQNK
jgi:hypothetical protein